VEVCSAGLKSVSRKFSETILELPPNKSST
jgi:hypothetical protein